MTPAPLLCDPLKMVQPLLDAVPGSRSVCSCRRCAQPIIGPAALDDRLFFIHPGDCPPAEGEA